MNKTFHTGNLTRDVEVRFTTGGTAVAEAGMAINEKYKKGEEWVEEVLFLDVKFFGRQAEVLGEYGQKGGKILVEGKLAQDSWEKDGVKRTKMYIKGERFEFLNTKKSNDKVAVGATTTSEPTGNTEDIPF
jgi:single-strand DNA-binding protein